MFDTESDAVARANAGEMGLAAGVFTSNLNTSSRVSREIKAGTIWTNTWAAINDGFAEGGYKQSGVGRLRGPIAFTEFQEAKTVVHAIPCRGLTPSRLQPALMRRAPGEMTSNGNPNRGRRPVDPEPAGP